MSDKTGLCVTCMQHWNAEARATAAEAERDDARGERDAYMALYSAVCAARDDAEERLQVAVNGLRDAHGALCEIANDGAGWMKSYAHEYAVKAVAALDAARAGTPA